MKKIACIIGFLICILPWTTSYGAEKAKALSPYFFVQSEDPTVDPFPPGKISTFPAMHLP